MSTDSLLAQVLDRQAISDAIHAYCRHVDMNNPAGVAALFTADCLVDYGPGLGPPTRGSDLLEKRLAAGLPRFKATSHHVSNVEIAFDGSDAADTCTYLHVWHRYHDDKPDAVLYARYHDRFVRNGDRWLISTRTLRVAGEEAFDVGWHPIGRND